MFGCADYLHSKRRGSAGNLFGGFSERASGGEVHCIKHPTERVIAVCHHQQCGKAMCRRCQESHYEAEHKGEAAPAVQITRKVSGQLEQTIRSVKDHKSKLEAEVRMHKQSVMSFVEKFFTQLQLDVDQASEKVICQLETRYLAIRNNGSNGLTNIIGKIPSYQLPRLEVDSNIISLETVLKRMIHLTKDVVEAAGYAPNSKGAISTAFSGATNGISAGGGTINNNPGVISTGVGPAIVITAPKQDIAETIKPSTATTTTQKFFGFPGSTYKHNPPKLEERRNHSLQRDVTSSRITERSRLSPDHLRGSTIKDPLLYTSRLYTERADKTMERPSLPTQPFAQLLKTHTETEIRVPLKEHLPTPNLEKVTSQKTFSPYEIQEILKKTSASTKKDYPRDTSTTTFFESHVVREKENPFKTTQPYYNPADLSQPISAVELNLDSRRTSIFTDLPSPTSAGDLGRAFEFHATTVTETPSYDRPAVSTYEHKYRKEYTTTDNFRL